LGQLTQPDGFAAVLNPNARCRLSQPTRLLHPQADRSVPFVAMRLKGTGFVPYVRQFGRHSTGGSRPLYHIGKVLGAEIGIVL
jgi:hypothetical protein